MKDGFDKSVAEKMPRIQKKRPNRPWNVDPVLLKVQEDEKAGIQEALAAVQEKPVEVEPEINASARAEEITGTITDLKTEAMPALAADAVMEEKPDTMPEARIEEVHAVAAETKAEQNVEPIAQGIVLNEKSENITKAVETIKELNSDFTQMIFDRKAIQKQLEKSSSAIEEVERENARLRQSILEVEKNTLENTLIEREIDFLNEQLEDADFYIQNMVGLLEEKEQSFEQEASLRKKMEGKFEKISKEIHEKAKMDVKISILEKDLSISTNRILELESKLDEEYQKREPLEQEIVELKDALDRVYSSLAHIRLKAKREVYGS